VKRPRTPAAKARKAAAQRFAARRFPCAYALPRLLDSSTAISGDTLEMYCRSTIRAAWAAGEHGRVKAAREHLARCRLKPADIAAIARSLADYNYQRKWPSRETAQKLDWLSKGAGCVEQFGTEYDAHLAAWSALSGALSIIVEVPPLEHTEDASALLSTLIYTGWRHVPSHQRTHVAQRMARFVSDSLTERDTWYGQTY
jgi:hypothetical protein